MNLCNCNFKCNCAVAAVVAGLVLGVVAAFLQITAVIAVTPLFLTVAAVVAVVYLGVLVVGVALAERVGQGSCGCPSLNVALTGILGTVATAVILLAAGIVATSVISAILVGLLVLFITLMIAGIACLVRSIADCND